MNDKDPLTRPWDERRRRATRIALTAIAVLLALAIGIYIGQNRVDALFPTGDAEVPAADADAAADETQLVPPPRAGNERLAGLDDGDRITIAGLVASVLPDRFTLDHRTGTVTVEMDDWDPAYREAMPLRKGDQVVVSGAIDDNLYLRKRIEAESVFINTINTYFYANPADEDNRPRPGFRPDADAYVDLVGTVEAVEGEGLLLRIGERQVRVSLGDVPPGERERVSAGDRLYLWGDMVFDAKAPTLAAKGLITLRN